jgi:hypothetical protein
MEGMVSKKILNVHYSTSNDSEEDMPVPSLQMKGLVIKLLEMTYGQFTMFMCMTVSWERWQQQRKKSFRRQLMMS